MIRTCDGTDDLLQMEDGTPCTCGLRFDDVDRYVIYPHQLIPPPLTDAEVDDLMKTLKTFRRPSDM